MKKTIIGLLILLSSIKGISQVIWKDSTIVDSYRSYRMDGIITINKCGGYIKKQGSIQLRNVMTTVYKYPSLRFQICKGDSIFYDPIRVSVKTEFIKDTLVTENNQETIIHNVGFRATMKHYGDE